MGHLWLGVGSVFVIRGKGCLWSHTPIAAMVSVRPQVCILLATTLFLPEDEVPQDDIMHTATVQQNMLALSTICRRCGVMNATTRASMLEV